MSHSSVAMGPVRDGAPAVTTDYDAFAQAYWRANESNLITGYYERPAMVELARQRLGADADVHVTLWIRPASSSRTDRGRRRNGRPPRRRPCAGVR